MEEIREELITTVEALNNFSKVSTQAITDIYIQLERIEDKLNKLEELFSTISRLDEK